MKDSLVSIIIPVFNRANLIGETLDSIINQSYENWECIIVDDGSKDNTLEVVKEFEKKDSRIRAYKRANSKPKGANACRNYGFELSKGEYINWFDSDDIMHMNNVLSHLILYEQYNINFSMAHALVFENSIDNVLGLRCKELSSNSPFEDYIMQNITWLTSTVFWNRKFLNKLNYLFDEELNAAQEWEFHCRVLSQSTKYLSLNTPLVNIRQHNDSITYNNSKVKEREWHYFLARCKIYFNRSIEKNKNVNQYLQNYLLKKTKQYLLNKEIQFAKKALTNFLLIDRKISFKVKLYTIIFMFTYTYFNKGYCLFKKIKY